jgi:hypothetical protein
MVRERRLARWTIVLLILPFATCAEPGGVSLEQDAFAAARARMVSEQIAARGATGRRFPSRTSSH